MLSIVIGNLFVSGAVLFWVGFTLTIVLTHADQRTKDNFLFTVLFIVLMLAFTEYDEIIQLRKQINELTPHVVEQTGNNK